MALEDGGKKRRNLNFIIDAAAFILLAFMTTTGLIMKYNLPAGLCYKKHMIWGMQRHEWGDVHFWLAVAFFSLMAVHLFLHWRWIVSVAMGKPREGTAFRAALGILGLVGVVALSVAPFVSPETVDQTAKYTSQELATVPISAAMSLKDVEARTGVSVDYLMVELDIPETASPDTKLADLCVEYQFKIDDVKEILLDYGLQEPEKE